MAIRIHRLKRLDDQSIELWIHDHGKADAEYVASQLRHIPHAEISDPYARIGTAGVLTYVNVRSTDAARIGTRTILNQISGNTNIEITTLDVSRINEPRTLEIRIQGRLIFQTRYLRNGVFAYLESENGIYGTETPAWSSLLEVESGDRLELQTHLVDFGMSPEEIETNLNWLQTNPEN